MKRLKPKKADFAAADAQIAELGGVENCRLIGSNGEEIPGFMLNGRLMALVIDDDKQARAMVKRLKQLGAATAP